MDASVYFRITNPRRALYGINTLYEYIHKHIYIFINYFEINRYKIQNPIQIVTFITFAALRNVSGQNTMQFLLEKRLEL